MFELLKKISSKKYNVLVFGNNQLNYAITKKIKKSLFLNNLYVANASEAMKKIAINIPFNNEALVEEAKRLKIDILICNDVANIQGIIDTFKENGIFCFGVNKKWTMLEASKHIGKLFVEKHNIRHPKYNILDENDDIYKYLNNYSYPIVVKANGYARGTGVYICHTEEDLLKRVDDIRKLRIKTSSTKIIIEEFISGKEISFMQFWDGKNLLSFPPVKDFKKRNNNDEGPNTGGMASYCPYQGLTKKENEELSAYGKKMKEILKNEKADFCGIIYSGLIFRNEKLYVLEYNMRLGSPEGIALLSNLRTDFLEMIILASKKKLNIIAPQYNEGTSFALSISCLKYPEEDDDIFEIPVEKIEEIEKGNINVLYTNGVFQDNKFIKKGNYGLVLEKNSNDPFFEIYNKLKEINIENAHYRIDINNYND